MFGLSRRSAALLALVACAAGGACTQEDAHPPQLGNCPADAHCVGPITGGGGTSSSDAGMAGASCSVNAGDSQCGQCEARECCSQLTACVNDSDCLNIFNC